MTERIIISGVGGQGVMLLGKILAEIVMREDKFVTWLPAYGAEVRGGTAYCMVIISDKEIGSPRIEKADTLIAMNNPSLLRFQGRLKDNGLLIVNSSLVTDYNKAKTVAHPFTDIALKLGNVKVANMVALGNYLSHRKSARIKTALKVIEEAAPADKKGLVGINQKALEEGYELDG